MSKKEDDSAQSEHGFHATVEAETPEEFSERLHDVFAAFAAAHKPKPNSTGQ